MKKIKGFSYDTEKDKDVIDYIEKQPHQAKYIWNLVRDNMNQFDNEIENLVRKYIKEILKEKNIDINRTQEIKVTEKDISQLLNIK